MVGPAETHWAEELARWAIPPEILASAPEPPWGFPPAFFRAPAEPEDSPSRRRALEALPPGGSVLDVGSGGGAACLALVPPAAQLVAVDETPAMLDMLGTSGLSLGVAVTTIVGRWPAIADRVPSAEVVVCHHVLYNAADLGEFVLALSTHATRRVVIEITERHPMVGLNHLWRHFHGVDRPEGPGVAEALAVLAEVGIDAQVERFSRPPRWQARDAGLQVGMARRRLCLTPDADPEIERLLEPGYDLLSTSAACIWWDCGRQGD